jgi:hypothetical protein
VCSWSGCFRRIAKVGDQGSFGANLKKFLDEGFIAKIQRTAIEHILESGHAAIHRGYKPVEHDLNTALNIVEAITETIYFHEEEAKSGRSASAAKGRGGSDTECSETQVHTPIKLGRAVG